MEAIQNTMNRALEMGADSYIIKPVAQDLFITEIKRVLNESGRM